jgi:hypothetical protein
MARSSGPQALSCLLENNQRKNMAITVGDLRRMLEPYPDETEIHFEELTFYRVKKRGDNLVQIEFSEAIVGGDEKRNYFQKPGVI